MLPKRTHRNDEQHPAFTDSERHLILAAETLRSGERPGKLPVKDDKSGDEKIALFWRVFGGTILSICALVVITAYQSLAGGIHDLRGDVGRIRETSGEYIKKDEFNTRSTTMWNKIQELQAINASVTVLTSKLTAVEQQLAAADRERKEMQTTLAQATSLKDRLAMLDELRKVSEQDHKDLIALSPVLGTLKERDVALEKQIKDAETERKEVGRELLMLRERLAKLEGRDEVKPPKPPAPSPARNDDNDSRP